MDEMHLTSERKENHPAEVKRTPEAVALEIRTLQHQAQSILLSYAIEIGRRLEEAKSLIPHGEWTNWLKTELSYSQSTAQNLMRVFREYGTAQQSLFGCDPKSQTFGNLTYSKALKLLAIPDEEEREAFVQENDVDHMSTRELDKALRELNDTKKALAQAEENRVRAEKEAADQRAAQQKARNSLIQLAEEKDAVYQELDAARAELEEIKAKPIEVAVEEPSVETMARIRAEAAEESAEKVRQAEARVAELEQKAAVAEASLTEDQTLLDVANRKADDLVGQIETKVAEAHAAHAGDADRIHDLERQLTKSDPDVAEFRVRFVEWQETYQKMMAVHARLAEKDAKQAEKLRTAITAALNNMHV